MLMTTMIDTTNLLVKAPSVGTVAFVGQTRYGRDVATIADRIRWLLTHLDTSASALSTKAGLSRTHVSTILERFEADARAKIELNTLQSIAEAGGIAWEWLVTGIGNPDGTGMATLRYSDHPEWAESVAAALRDHPRHPPAWAYAAAGREPHTRMPKRFTAETARAAAEFWMDTADDDALEAAETGWTTSEVLRSDGPTGARKAESR